MFQVRDDVEVFMVGWLTEWGIMNREVRRKNRSQRFIIEKDELGFVLRLRS